MEKKILADALVRPKLSSPDKQVAFLKEVIFEPDEYDKFLSDPVGYCSKQSPPISLDPKVIALVDRIVMDDEPITEEATELLGKSGVEEVKKFKISVDRLQRVDWPLVLHDKWREIFKKIYDALDKIDPLWGLVESLGPGRLVLKELAAKLTQLGKM